MAKATGQPHARKKRKKWLKAAKGFYGGRHRLYRTAREVSERALQFSYIGRKRKKRDFRRLWIARINAAVRENGLKYSQFIHALKLANIHIDRKNLAELAVRSPRSFQAIVERAKTHITQ